MPDIVCIRFKQCGKLYDFESGETALKPGDVVVVESDLGLSIGKVVCKSLAGEAKEYKKVLRLASEEDIRESKSNAGIEKEAFDFCRERVMARGLQMKLIRTEATLDRKRIIFYFISEKRIDFRELVKDLAQKFRTRIEMRQVGVRDEAKMTGGLGLCGRQLCCASFLSNFAPISIKMAKKQELVLNTGKLSGICGRLMCCLSYEYGNNVSRKEARENEASEVIINEEASLNEAATSEATVRVPEAPHRARTEQKTSGTAHSAERKESLRGGKNSHFERRDRRPRSQAPEQASANQGQQTKQAMGPQTRGPQAPGRPSQRPQSQEPRPHGARTHDLNKGGPLGPAAQDNAPSGNTNIQNGQPQDSQNIKRKKKKRWRKRGNKSNAPGESSPGAPQQNSGTQNPGSHGSPDARPES